MKRNRKNTIHIGQRLLTLMGQTNNSAGRPKNLWEDHGVFPSRQLAYAYASKVRPNKKAHVEGVRINVTEREPQRRNEAS
jgi:hypothetical protein